MDLSRALGKASEAVTAAQDSYSNSTLSSDRAHQSAAIAMEALVSLEEEYEQATLLRDDLEVHGEDMQIEAERDNPAKLGEELMRLRRIESQLREDRDRADSKYREAEMRLEKARARLDAQTHGSAAVAARRVGACISYGSAR